jgi:flavin reductase (DIM6/NTAB) family NADH-FMN oxidoreductase RutF
MFKTAGDFDYEVSEFEQAGLLTRRSQRVQVPGVALSPIQFECELMQIVHVGTGPLAANLIIGKILLIEIDDSVLNHEGKIDPTLVDTVGRMGGFEYCRTSDRFSLKPT